jgi:hypothetical protein
VPDHRGSRFALEVLFLVGLAVGLTLARLTALEIGGVMALGWVIVASLEWAAWRGEPHFGSGLPPRYYVPGLNLPPAQPLEQVATGYPEAARDEAPTWIASAALRQEMLGEWPVAMPMSDDERQAAEPRSVEGSLPIVDPWLVAELPAAPLGELAEEVESMLAAADAAAALETNGKREAEPELESAREPLPDPDADPDPDREPEPQPHLAVQPDSEPELLPVAVSEPVRKLAASGLVQVSRHSLDPLAEPPVRRRFRRSAVDEVPTVEVPARPAGVRALPGGLERRSEP